MAMVAERKQAKRRYVRGRDVILTEPLPAGTILRSDGELEVERQDGREPWFEADPRLVMLSSRAVAVE